ncbi:hypothetical protein PHLCEN_2v4907 [Hermanssonia centrifuga]|uniref:Uncharacterized protein n=1 Tax=Hermanssonia centrifuga TaxID=98765 RepID=A0A2R6PG11_9APHY|nr:hypothetical protein PHLCEN_2v4907 [Hermanssonia centrifuga]
MQLLQGRPRPSSSFSRNRPDSTDPFGDNVEQDDRSPLVNPSSAVEGTRSRGATTSISIATSSRSASRAGAVSPARTVVSRAESRHTTNHAVGHDSQTGSRYSPLSPRLFARKSQINEEEDLFSDADWSHMDDPFANPNARSVDLDPDVRDATSEYGVGGQAQGKYSLLQKMRGRS